MRIEELCFRLSIHAVNDLMVSWLQSDQVKQLAVQFNDESLHFTGEYRWGMLTVPIDLTVKVAGVTPDRLDLSLSSANLSATSVEELLRTLIKNSGVDGVQLADSHVAIHIDTLATAIGGQCRFQSVVFSEQGIEIKLEELVLPDDVLRHMMGSSRVPAAPVGMR